jgi:hypothetical protein
LKWLQSWRGRHYITQKHWYPSIKPHGITSTRPYTQHHEDLNYQKLLVHVRVKCWANINGLSSVSFLWKSIIGIIHIYFLMSLHYVHENRIWKRRGVGRKRWNCLSSYSHFFMLNVVNNTKTIWLHSMWPKMLSHESLCAVCCMYPLWNGQEWRQNAKEGYEHGNKRITSRWRLLLKWEQQVREKSYTEATKNMGENWRRGALRRLTDGEAWLLEE